MEIGVVFPQTEIGSDPRVLREFAEAAEALGYAHILAFDHVVGAVHAERVPPLQFGYNERTGFHEPLALFSYVSGVTTRIGLATGVLVLPQRQTVLVAKQAAEVAILSSGRLRLGVGTGWNYVEYDSLNERFANRGRRLDEQVAVLRRLWTEPVVDFTGEFHRIDRAGIQPMPAATIPVWFGGNSEVAFRRAARIGDGFMFSALESAAKIPRLRALLAEAGRGDVPFGIEGRVNFGKDASAARWTDEIGVWERAGASCIAVNTMAAGFRGRDHVTAIERFADAAGVTKPV